MAEQKKRTRRKYKQGQRVMTTHGQPSRIHKAVRGGAPGDPLYVIAHEDGSGGGIERESALQPLAAEDAQ